MFSALLFFDVTPLACTVAPLLVGQGQAQAGVKKGRWRGVEAAPKPRRFLKAYALALGLAAAGIAHAQAPAASAPAGPGLFSSLVYAPGVGLQSRDWRTQCAERLPPTQVSVAVMPSHITYNRPSSLELTRYFQMKPGNVSLGRTTAQPRISTRVGGKALAPVSPEQAGCYRPQLDITLSFGSQLVSIAQEIPIGSCGYRHVLNHELEHVRINQEGLKALAGLLKQVLVQRYGNQVFFGEPRYWQAQLQKDVEAWRPWLEKELEKKLRRQHQALDSPQEYAKNRAVCNGELARVIDLVAGG